MTCLVNLRARGVCRSLLVLCPLLALLGLSTAQAQQAAADGAGAPALARLTQFKDKDGNIFVKPKDGSGPGDPTGLNIDHL